MVIWGFSWIVKVHPVLKFSCEKEKNAVLSFFEGVGILGLSTTESEFDQLIHCALIICFQTKLNSEIEFITKVLAENWYPLYNLQSSICTKILQFKKFK